jgi:hypothetical protein
VKIRISHEGHLYLQRGDRVQQQTCPYKNLPCGDWCPFFGEVEPERRFANGANGLELIDNGHRLTICEGRVLVGEITDERGAK